MNSVTSLIQEIKSCTHCQEHLPLPPNPVVSFSRESRILVVGQAPGIKVHETSIPWNDPSGDRLRQWLDVSREEFYNPKLFAIVPMGFCYPGKGKSGDLPPRPECAELWNEPILKLLKNIQLTLLVGQYAQNFYLNDSKKKTLTLTIQHFKEYLPDYFVLPHPSPRNNIWLKKNPWFEKETLPKLKRELKRALKH
ncbi:MAG: uracil-DNA glycosylase family protein [Candidatus Nitronauta litoralis]|uniref:Uracil-DNA glycosylase family protein n=1 Tax=Candidatus Nitronauta litoralis TaxID=2705533 RepID=A0A7T0BX48_9BACT|nr:MAG: uracil-DNA glycosylase family protein [Candidatus Nitronauta litoralis]